MNNIESGLVKIGMWAFGVMFAAIFTMVTLTYQSQIRTEEKFNAYYNSQLFINQYTVRRLGSDSVSIIALNNRLYILEYWVRKIKPEVYNDDPPIPNKFEAILPKEEDQTIIEQNLLR